MIEAWLCISVMTFLVSIMVMQGGIQSWSVLALFVIAAVCLFRSMQPQRTYLELSGEGFAVVWGLHSSFTRWDDLAELRLVAPDDRACGVAISTIARTHDFLGCWQRNSVAPFAVTLRGADYGTSDWRLYQLMTNFRRRALSGDEPALNDNQVIAAQDA